MLSEPGRGLALLPGPTIDYEYLVVTLVSDGEAADDRHEGLRLPANGFVLEVKLELRSRLYRRARCRSTIRGCWRALRQCACRADREGCSEHNVNDGRSVHVGSPWDHRRPRTEHAPDDQRASGE